MEELEKKINKFFRSKEFIVWDEVRGYYSVISEARMKRIEKEFGEHTTLGRVFPYSEEKWEELKTYREFSLFRWIINKLGKRN